MGVCERSEGEWDLGESECERDEERERELRLLRDEDLPLLELLEYLVCAGDAAVTPLECGTGDLLAKDPPIWRPFCGRRGKS